MISSNDKNHFFAFVEQQKEVEIVCKLIFYLEIEARRPRRQRWHQRRRRRRRRRSSFAPSHFELSKRAPKRGIKRTLSAWACIRLGTEACFGAWQCCSSSDPPTTLLPIQHFLLLHISLSPNGEASTRSKTDATQRRSHSLSQLSHWILSETCSHSSNSLPYYISFTHTLTHTHTLSLTLLQMWHTLFLSHTPISLSLTPSLRCRPFSFFKCSFFHYSPPFILISSSQWGQSSG